MQQQQLAYVLHRRSYRDTSYIVELLTQQHGRISVVARGVRNNKRSAVLQPFTPLSVSWTGRGELLTLVQAEVLAYVAALQGECLLSALYINELMLRVVPKQDSCAHLFNAYVDILQRLRSQTEVQANLRRFEKSVLHALGYELSLAHEAHSNEPVQAEAYYRFSAQHGLTRHAAPCDNRTSEPHLFSGVSVLALYHDALDTHEKLRDAKRLMRLAFAPLLGLRPLKSRSLFREPVAIQQISKIG